jgi:hypothetical protein
MAFRNSKISKVSIQDPESLLRDLRLKKIQGLLSHQADVVRNYCEIALSESDVAIQLPTGSGKTLVGLIIAEWRRRKYGEKVVYLCPTRQLVYQVKEQAINQYGINVNTFTGSKTEYDPNASAEYLGAEAIAITSYSGLFNVKPFFDSPDFIVLDDAHSAENYIASTWSIAVSANEHRPLFDALCALLRPIIPKLDYKRLVSEADSFFDLNWVDMVPGTKMHDIIDDLSSILNEHVEKTDLIYPWLLLRSHIDACNLFIGSKEILIRPLLPPTYTHGPFRNANQRLYMSATLGECGELERITGRKNIVRLNVPQGWDKQGIGRRCFFFPERSFEMSDAQELISDFIKLVPRALFLVPDGKTATNIIGRLKKDDLPHKVFDAREIEQSKQPFISNDCAITIAQNRYDGIDFPEEECRLLIVEGLPRGTNLQETFFISRLGALVLLNDRILTRIVQAFGRCTRSATDYSAVIVTGSEMCNFLMDRHRRISLHPELQAELEFGIENSKDITKEELIENLRIFLEHGKEWELADQEILSIRDSCHQATLPCTDELRRAAQSEVDYVLHLWNHDYLEALAECKKVLSALQAPELKGYRILWNYLAGCAAHYAYKNGYIDQPTQSKNYFAAALRGKSGISWLAGLAHVIEKQEKDGEDNSLLISMLEKFETKLEVLGIHHDLKYDQEEKFILDGINSNDSSLFEKAHERLGKLMGFEAGNKETQGAPDPWWILSENMCFIFEDHNEAKEDSQLDITKARQAASHPKWVKDNLPVNKDATVLPILITPVKKVSKDVMTHLNGVYIWQLNDFREWVRKVLGCLREARKKFTESGNIIWRANTASFFEDAEIAPDSIIRYICEKVASDVLKVQV